MNWETINIEDIMESNLIRDLNKTKGKTVFGYYTKAREDVLDNVVNQINSYEPGLTDHGSDHIADVLKKTESLLRIKIKEMNGVFLYILLQCILFHDVGNVYGREGHNKAIKPIYDLVRGVGTNSNEQEEKKVILSICEAHSGKTNDGSYDTLKLVEDITNIFGQDISPKEIASILRFADELSEGPQRTSKFMLSTNSYEESDLFYHQYANCTTIHIDPRNNRIALKYHISLKENHSNNKLELTTNELKLFLPLLYIRISKLNQERKYTKHYCQQYLSPYDKITVSIDFWWEGSLLDIGISKGLLTDLVVPNDEEPSFIKKYPMFKIDNIIPLVKDNIKKLKPPGYFKKFISKLDWRTP